MANSFSTNVQRQFDMEKEIFSANDPEKLQFVLRGKINFDSYIT
jgi:hypothetical protein